MIIKIIGILPFVRIDTGSYLRAVRTKLNGYETIRFLTAINISTSIKELKSGYLDQITHNLATYFSGTKNSLPSIPQPYKNTKRIIHT